MMATTITWDQFINKLDSTSPDFKGTFTKKLPNVPIALGNGICIHVLGDLACLHVTPDGKQRSECCLAKFVAGLEQLLNVTSHSGEPYIQNISLISCKVADLLLRKTVVNKPFKHQDLHMTCLSQLYVDYKLCTLKTIREAMDKLNTQAKDLENSTQIIIKDMNLSLAYKSQLKMPSPLMLASDSVFHSTDALLDYIWHKNAGSSELTIWPTDMNSLDPDESHLEICPGLLPIKSKLESVNTIVDFLKHENIIRLTCDEAEKEDTWCPDKDFLIIHKDSYSDDDIDIIPQFDGTSDKTTDPAKNSDRDKLPVAGNQGADCVQESGDSNNQAPGSELNTSATPDGVWRTTGSVEGGSGNQQSYSSGGWSQAWPQHSDSGGGSWHGNSQTWPQQQLQQQQQQYDNWPQQQCLPSSFPQQQATFQSQSPTSTFQSPPHNPYSSGNHQQTFQTQSQYPYPPYQSPPTNQTYQQPYKSPQHPYQSPRYTSQGFNSPQPYNSPSYQPMPTSQPYHPAATHNQPYQLPQLNKPYASPTTGNQSCSSQSTNLPYQSQSSSNSFQQSNNVQTYPSSYQTTHSNQMPHQQPYHSPGHDLSQPSWNTQSCSGYNQSHQKHTANLQNKPEQHLAELSQPHPSTQYGQPVNPISDNQDTFFPSKGYHQQVLSGKPTGTSIKSAPEAQSSQFGVSPAPKKRAYKKRKDSKAKGVSEPPISSSSIDTPSVVTETRFFQLKSDNTSTLGDSKSTVPLGCTSPVTKTSIFESTSLNSQPSISKCMEPSNNSPLMKTELADKITTTPMIQQLLMEEPIRMNIKKEVRDAVMKKPVASSSPPKPKRKYKARVKQSQSTPKRPRSTSLSSPVPPMVGYCGYSPQPMMNSPMIGRPARSHSVSLPFSYDCGTPSPIHNYSWQQWRQHVPPNSEWQQEQPHRWGINERHNLDSSGHNYSPVEMSKPELTANSLHHSSISPNTIQSPVCSQNIQLSQSPSLFHNQSGNQNSLQITVDSNHSYSDRENASPKSSLSSLFQLISDVGSNDTCWENDSVSIPNIFSNSSELETDNVLMSVSDLNEESPPTKDFITLETPCKQEYEKISSDSAGITPEESDRIDFDLINDLKSIHPRVGKQNRLKKLGIFPIHTKFDSAGFPIDSNPAYTYTFHVPTTMFKKLKFFRSAESRKPDVNVVRMHPMDARRYSLMKIGHEIVSVTKLTDEDLASYNVTLPPAHVMPTDGYMNRVNLDIPTVRTEHDTSDNGEKIIFSKFDTDFPPNKVAPPSSFCASQISSVNRTSSISSYRFSSGSSRMQQHINSQPRNYNGGVVPVSQQLYTSLERNNYSSQPHSDLHAVQGNINRQSSSQQAQENSNNMQPFNRKTNSSFSCPAASSTDDCHHINQQVVVSSNNQQDQLQQEQQSQARSSDFHPEPKNGLRSLGQHGLTNSIESGRTDDVSSDQEAEFDITTKDSHFNTQVNAHLWNNHAEDTSNCIAAHPCTSQHQQKSLEHSDLAYQIDITKVGCSEADKTVNVPKVSDYNNTPTEDGLLMLSKTDYEENNYIKNSQCSTDHCQDDQLKSRINKKNKTDTSLDLNTYKSKGSLCWRKNRKALSLTIPKYSEFNLLHVKGKHNSDYMEKSLVSTCQRGSDENDNCNNNTDSSLRRKTTRVYTLEGNNSAVEGKLSTRQAKLRSVYSHSPLNKKPKKRRKRQGPLKEGVHYIVVGKFKGHQSMQVKINKLNVNSTELIKADHFEELAAKDIIRLISPPLSCSIDEEAYHPIQSNRIIVENSNTTHLNTENEYHEFDQNANSRSRSAQLASRGRSGQQIKFRSTKQQAKLKSCAVSDQQILENTQTNSVESKNGMAGPSRASKNNKDSTQFVEDKFFNSLKEIFMHHHRIKEQVVNKELKGDENIFFEGIRKGSFENFQQNLISNVQKLMGHDYSSSSDDEDDVLDSTILKRMINTAEELEVSQVSGKTDHSKLMEGFHKCKSDVKNGLSEEKNTFSGHADESRFKQGSQTARESNKLWESTRNEACYITKDHEEISGNSIDYPPIEFKNKKQDKGESRREFLKTNKNEDDVVDIKIMQKSMKNVMQDTKIPFEMPALRSQTVTCTIQSDGGDDKEDYLKCQMAFFEDISSDSNSNDTVILDSCIEKNTFHMYTPFSFTATDHLATESFTKCEYSHDNHHATFVNANESCNSENNETMNSHFRDDCADVSQASGTNNKPDFCINIKNINDKSLDKSLTHISQGSVSEIINKNDNGNFKLSEQQKDNSFVTESLVTTADFSPVSEVETMELENISAVPAVISSKCDNICISTTVTENETLDMVKCSEHNTETIDTSPRQTRYGKRIKRSVRDKKSRLHKRRQSSINNEHSCNIRTDVSPHTDTSDQHRSHGQRKRTCYAYETDKFDSTHSTDSGDEDFAASYLKNLKNNRKTKSIGPKDKQIQNPPETLGNRGTRGRSARGRRKKQGGDKLLNSLSLLHMATLANLTETVSDQSDDQLVSENELSWQYSDKFNQEGNTTSTMREKAFAAIPETSHMQSSSAGKRRHTRNCAKEKIAQSTILVDTSQKSLTTLKPECTRSTNIGSKPLAFSRIVNNSTSSSPVPSNFAFNHNSDSNQPEAANSTEDTGTNNILQLLETRRAQVNCASFSMNDIRKLTTPDDSVDSDSKSNVPKVKFSRPEKIQTKSTIMNTNDKHSNCEIENEHEFKTNLLSNQPYQANYVPLSGSHTLSGTLSSYDGVSQILDSNRCNVEEETSQASSSLLSQLAKFSNSTPPQLSKEISANFSSKVFYSANITNSVPEISSKIDNAQSSSLIKQITELMPSCETEANISDNSELPPLCASVKIKTEIESTNSKSNLQNNSKSLGSMKNKHPCDVSKSTTQHIRNIQESQNVIDILKKKSISITLRACQERSNSPNFTSLSEAQSLSPSNSLVSESFASTSSNSNNSSQKHMGGLDRTSCTPTSGTIVQTAGVKNTSMNCVEESEKPHIDSYSIIPSQVPLQSNIPETPVSAEIEIEMISVVSEDKFINEKLIIHRPQTLIPKQEHRGCHKNLKVRNTYRGIKPLHPLQIPSYSYIDHGPSSQWEQASHNYRSLYYPDCWQWPAYTPGSDPAISPLNLCTTQKSPNNYSPITPTSPISPNYPTQAQGVTESDLSSSPVATGKPLWYPWQKVEAIKTDAKIGSPGYQHKHLNKDYIKPSIVSSTSPITAKDQTSDYLCREAAQGEQLKVKQDARVNSESERSSLARYKGTFSSFITPSLKFDHTPSSSSTFGTALNMLETTYDKTCESLPSTSCSVQTSLKNISEDSGIALFDVKDGCSRKNVDLVSVTDSAYWSADTSKTPDSLDSCQSNNSSSSKSS